MNILALDTSGEACSTALLCAHELHVQHVEAPHRHTELVLRQLDALRLDAGLTWSQIDAIAFGSGPGAFTGVRIAASVAHGLALAHNTPLIPISSLAALAQGAWRLTGITTQLVLLDARRQEVYVGRYTYDQTTQTVRAQHDDALAAPSIVTPPSTAWVAAGRGWDTYPPLQSLLNIAHARADLAFPNAGDIAQLAAHHVHQGQTFSPADAQPRYLRAPV